MSRSNHYRIGADDCVDEGCWCHGLILSPYRHKPERVIVGRRTWERKSRWPRHSVRYFSGAPSRLWWKEQHARARAIYREMMFREDDPALPAESRLIDMWDWD